MTNISQPGIVVTQAGVSARYAADYQMVFNSNWPSLQTAFDTTVTLSAGTSQTIPHGLKIYPFTIGTVISNGVSIGRIFKSSASLEITPPTTTITMTFDDTNVYLTSTDSQDYQVNIKCHNLDITKQDNYAFPAPPILKTPYDPTTGIKVVKYGESIGNTDLRKFILHSRAQSPAVLTVETQLSAFNAYNSIGGFYLYVIAYVNPANYVPWTFAFYDNGNGRFYCVGPGSQQSTPGFFLVSDVAPYLTQVKQPGLTGAGSVISYTDSSDPKTSNIRASLIMLRDPLIVASTLQVNYNG